MTIDVNKNKVIYLGTGTVKEYDYDFTMPTNESCVVYKLFNVNSRIDLTEGIDYTLSETGIDVPAGTVTLTDFLEEDFRLVIYRSNNFLQEIDFANQRSYFLDKIEDSIDMLTIFTQQLFEAMGRSIQIAITEDGPVILPEEDRANKVLGFDENGNPDYFVPTTYLQFATEEEAVLGIVPDKAVSPKTLSRANLRVKSIAELRLYNGYSDTDKADVLGYHVSGDGGGGPDRVYKDGQSPGFYVDNGGSIIVPNGGDGSAAWLFAQSNHAAFDVAWFGAGLGLGDDSPRIRACYDAAFNGDSLSTAVSEVTPIKGYSTNFVINTSLDLGNESTGGVKPPTGRIEIIGTFITNPSLTYAIKLVGFRKSNVRLGDISSSSDSSGIGVIMENCFESDISFEQIINYNIPLQTLGEGSYGTLGSAYCNVSCQKIGLDGFTTKCHEMTTSAATAGYVNSNVYQLKNASGDTFTAHVKSVAQTSEFNGNIYQFCGLEKIALIGFDFEFSFFNTVLWPRLEGSAVFANGVIQEASDSTSNDYFLQVIKQSKIGTLQRGSNIRANLRTDSGSFASFLGTTSDDGTIYYTGADAPTTEVENLTYFASGNTFATDSGNPMYRYAGYLMDGNGEIHPVGLKTPYSNLRITSYTAGDTIQIGYARLVDITVDSGQLSIQARAEREFEGFYCYLNIKNAMSDLEVLESDGSIDIPASYFVTNGSGLYYLVRNDFDWRISRIGDRIE